MSVARSASWVLRLTVLIALCLRPATAVVIDSGDGSGNTDQSDNDGDGTGDECDEPEGAKASVPESKTEEKAARQ